jgi:hypothetical protein
VGINNCWLVGLERPWRCVQPHWRGFLLAKLTATAGAFILE